MKTNLLKKRRLFVIAALFLSLSVNSFGYPKKSLKDILNGPWEIVVKVGFEEAGLVFPLEISKRDKVQNLDQTKSLEGTDIVLKLKKYLPDYRSEEYIAADPNGSSIASISIKGNGLDQKMNLIADDPARRSISSPVGGIGIRQFDHKENIEKFLNETASKDAVGVLTVELESGPVDVIVGKEGKYEVGNSKYSLEVLGYFPHYTIDRKTKKVANASEMPTNPAIKVRLNDGNQNYEKWLWSRFSISPHQMEKLPVNIVFNDFDLAGSEGRYIIVPDGDDTWITYIKGGKKIVERTAVGIPYPFKNHAYAFAINQIVGKGVIKQRWTNKSEKLLRPAVLFDVIQGDKSHEVLIPFEKPGHIKIEQGTLVFYHRVAGKDKGK